VVAIHQHPTEKRTDPEDREVVRRDDAVVDADRIVGAGQAHGLWVEAAGVNIGQRLLPLAIVAEVRVGGVVEAAAVLRAADVDKPRRVAEAGKRSKEQRARDREDCGARADADREGQGRREREQRAAAEESQRVANVLQSRLGHARLITTKIFVFYVMGDWSVPT